MRVIFCGCCGRSIRRGSILADGENMKKEKKKVLRSSIATIIKAR